MQESFFSASKNTEKDRVLIMHNSAPGKARLAGFWRGQGPHRQTLNGAPQEDALSDGTPQEDMVLRDGTPPVDVVLSDGAPKATWSIAIGPLRRTWTLMMVPHRQTWSLVMGPLRTICTLLLWALIVLFDLGMGPLRRM